MTTDPLDLDRLVELAETQKWALVEAPAPPWGYYPNAVETSYYAAYIAAVSPSTVLALVRELREARTALEMVRDWQDFDSVAGIAALLEEVEHALRDKS